MGHLFQPLNPGLPAPSLSSANSHNSLVLRCDRLTSCTVPVSSDLFGDPCPGTHKYVEIHYTCSPKTSDITRRPPLPPWYLQPVQKPDEVKHNTWLPNSAIQKERDIAPVPNTYSNSRIPILVATTTEPPKRIPITTPRPTTPTTTTTTQETTTVDATSEELPHSESSQLALDKYGKDSVFKTSIQYSEFSRKLLKVIYLFTINKKFA